MKELKLKDLIGKTVSDVSIVERCSLHIEFEDATYVEASLGGDYLGEDWRLDVDMGVVN